jgi:hypothetical protein
MPPCFRKNATANTLETCGEQRQGFQNGQHAGGNVLRTFGQLAKSTFGQLAKNPEENATYLPDYFQSAFSPTVNPRGNDITHQMPQLPQQVEWTPPTKAELTKAISSLKDTASGPSGMPACVWKSIGSEQETSDILLHVMQQCWLTKTTPVTWSKSHMAVIPKKGDSLYPSRRISDLQWWGILMVRYIRSF